MECCEGELYRMAFIELHYLSARPRGPESLCLQPRGRFLECVPLFASRVDGRCASALGARIKIRQFISDTYCYRPWVDL